MKIILVVLVGFICFTRCVAQVQDSTQIKLDQYKKWHELGLISDEEYNTTKAKLLNLPVEIKQKEIDESKIYFRKIDTISLGDLHQRFKSKIIAGSVILSFGVVLINGAVVYHYVTKGQIPTGTIGLAVIGSLSTITGAVLLGLGIHDRVVFRERKASLSMDVSLNQIGLTYNF